MNITALVHKTGRAGKWSSEDQEMYYGTTNGSGPKTVRVIKHCTTTMLVFNPETGEVLDWSTGHGSVSDQQGVNRILRELGSDLYFSRKGGAQIG